jgi:threonine dehydratase
VELVESRTIPFALVEEARRHVYDAAARTPLVRLQYDHAPAEIYLKLENLQPIGSFKIRGAYNAVRTLPADVRAQGVWTVSAGNAAQGVALAAQRVGVPCRVLVIETAPAAKLNAIRRLGAEIVPASYDDCWKALGERAHPAMTGAFVHPFEDDAFIAGGPPRRRRSGRSLRRRRSLLRNCLRHASPQSTGSGIRGRA